MNFPNKQILWLSLVLGCGASLALFASKTIAQAAAMHSLATSSPYLQPLHAPFLYGLTPLVVLGSFLFYLTPGLLWSLIFTKVHDLLEWVLLAFAISLVVYISSSTLLKLVLGTVHFTALSRFWLLMCIIPVSLLFFRNSPIVLPVVTSQDRRRMLQMLAVTFIGVVVLLPKIFWENFNLDGVEAFEFGRSLKTHFLPYWEIHEGVFGFYHNFLLFAYVNNWFISLFGEVEAAVRLPFFLYLIVLYCGTMKLIEDSQERLRPAEEGVLWMGFALFTIVQTYDTNYEPFFADLAEMGATDTLWIATFVAALCFLLSNRFLWFWIYGMLTFLSSPGGFPLLAVLAVVLFLFRSKVHQGQLRAAVSLVLVCLSLGVADELFYNPLVLGGVRDQFSFGRLLARFYPPAITEFARLNALIFPSGILPALSLFFWRRQDSFSRIITLVTVFFFGALYVQRWTALHQFTPVMVLPLIVFWRLCVRLPSSARITLVMTLVIATAVSIVLSLPRHFQINLLTREFGQATEYRVADYSHSYEQLLRSSKILDVLLPRDYRLKYPEQPWSTDRACWIYYATRPKPAGTSINYIVQRDSDPAPEHFHEIARKEGLAVYVRDLGIWKQHQNPDIPRVITSPLYEPILRNAYRFFRHYAEQSAPAIKH